MNHTLTEWEKPFIFGLAEEQLESVPPCAVSGIDSMANCPVNGHGRVTAED